MVNKIVEMKPASCPSPHRSGLVLRWLAIPPTRADIQLIYQPPLTLMVCPVM
ncbi:hypothetical protein EZJ58_2885 [Sodalis ligni]|uniref:Uncharacterized protein n=1 Tax=Sodalis ligni TaxID=2697027 RepID=A0A4R1ND78_9GAMM|nr:hypothetical protein EZJ58_2885 [Sodalis ligni]